MNEDLIVNAKITHNPTLAPWEKWYFPTVMVSDQHIGKSTLRSDLFYEFLKSTRFDTLILDGDFLDGWRIEKWRKGQDFNTWDKRVFDCLNYKANNGTDLYYIPGNHDERLRKLWHKSQKIYGIKNRHLPVMNPTLRFKHPQTEYESDLIIRPYINYIDPKGQKVKIMHGDEFDPKYFETKWMKWISDQSDYIYDWIVQADRYFKKLGYDTKMAKAVKKWAKKRFGVIDLMQKMIEEFHQSSAYDKLLIGHLHAPYMSKTYMNSGDWIEDDDCTAVVHDENGDWSLVWWGDKRKDFGFINDPYEDDNFYEFQAYRDLTELQLEFFKALWTRQKSEVEDVRQSNEAAMYVPEIVIA